MEEITNKNFEQTLQQHEWMMVDFWAAWCGPCKMMAPVIEQLAGEMGPKVAFAKLDVDQNAETAQKFGVTSVPTFIVFHKGTVKDQIVGTQSKEALKQRITQSIQEAGE